MKSQLNDIEVHYVNYGNPEKGTIVLLHGWGQNIEMMKPVGDAFQKDYQIIIIDLPGFGESSEPSFTWTVYDYVEFLNQFLTSLEIKKPILVGHSFGGKIAMLYSSTYEVEKLILFGSPFKRSFKKDSFKTRILKLATKIPGTKKLAELAKKYIGSDDYKNASSIMREVLVSTVNLDITEEVSKIKIPTIIIWGEFDEAVPLEHARELEQLISNSGLIVYEGCSHYAYLERLIQTNNIINSFLKS